MPKKKTVGGEREKRTAQFRTLNVSTEKIENLAASDIEECFKEEEKKLCLFQASTGGEFV